MKLSVLLYTANGVTINNLVFGLSAGYKFNLKSIKELNHWKSQK